MSELINRRDSRATIRWKLLTSASALALTAAVSTVNVAKAEDADHPLIWVELGGQMESISGQGQAFAPDFLAVNPDSPVLVGPTTPVTAQRLPKFNFGEAGKISFQPEGSDWIFSAAIRYGRSGNTRHLDHQTNGVHYKYNHGEPGQPITVADFADTHAQHEESHAILDFLAGKDVGLGMFGKESVSTLGFGVRFAQFTSRASFDIRARPDLNVKYYPSAHSPSRDPLKYFHTYHATGQASRSFRGVGPSLSWNGSTPFVGSPQDGEITLDWGVNAAVLFGKQKARVRHHESGHYISWLRIIQNYDYVTAYTPRSGGHHTDRSVTVPNVGGMAGISFRKGDAKISFGYRADFFFGAIDTGIDAAKKSNASFNGPYASISVGLGD